MIVSKIEGRYCLEGAEIILYTHDRNAVNAFMDTYIQGKEYEAVIKRKRAKRSLDANAYCWVLCGKIAQVLGAYTAEEIYQECIRKYGVSTISPQNDDLVKDIQRMWDAQGVGNQSIVLGPCKNAQGFSNMKFYWGSSGYDTAQMARLIDGIVSEAQELNIETMTPEEITKLKAIWR